MEFEEYLDLLEEYKVLSCGNIVGKSYMIFK